MTHLSHVLCKAWYGFVLSLNAIGTIAIGYLSRVGSERLAARDHPHSTVELMRAEVMGELEVKLPKRCILEARCTFTLILRHSPTRKVYELQSRAEC